VSHVLQPAQRRHGKPSAAFDALVRWWSSATQEARYQLLTAAWKKDPNAPPLGTVQLAALIAESEAGEVGEG
jgi:hypothetical protein